jgi:hypothetical protein
LGDRDRTTDIVLYDSDYGFAMNIIRDLYLGPGQPGPGDEWKFPTGPVADSNVGGEAPLEPALGELQSSEDR